MRALWIALLLITATTIHATDEPSTGTASTFTGQVSDKSCGRSVDAACNKVCIDRGIAPVLVLDQIGDVLEVANPELLRNHPGAHVTVTGTRDGSLLRVASLKVLSAPKMAAMTSMNMNMGASATIVHFPPDRDSVRIPFEVLANAPHIQVMVNGKGPFNFEVDTGSHLVFAQELAAEMGLDPNASSQTAEITLGDGLTMKVSTPFAEFGNLWGLPGRRIYGDIGSAVLEHFVTEFDYQHGVLTLHDPKKYHYEGRGAVLPSVLSDGYDPQFHGEFVVPGMAPMPAKFTLDTGAGGTVISVPLVKKYDLLERVKQQITPPPAKPMPDGMNGTVFEAVTSRIGAVKLGKYTLEQPLVALSRDTGTIFATDTLGVNLGGNILRHFTLIIDYPGNRVILEPNDDFKDPFLADGSGLVLAAEGNNFKKVVVHGVVPGSPAEEGGIQEGDVVTAVDGEPTDRYALWQLQDLLKESGRERALTIRRGGSTSTVKIKLRALV